MENSNTFGTRVIFKYQLNGFLKTTIKLPKGSCPLTVQMQDGTPTLWVEQPAGEEATESVNFHVVGTGWEFERLEMISYIATYQVSGCVWHIYAGPRE